MGQQPSESYPYPINDIAVSLPSGTVVRIRNIVIFKSVRGDGLTLYIETPTPPTERQRVATEATELLEKFTIASSKDATHASVGICRTRACLEMREIPPEFFTFVRNADGKWDPQKLPGS